MTLWIVLAVLMVFCLLLLIRRAPSSDTINLKQVARMHYDEQLSLLEHDLQNGKIDKDSYRINKAEITRTFMREADASSENAESNALSTFLLISLVVFTTGLSLIIYMNKGRPDLESVSHASATSMLEQKIGKSETTLGEALERLEADLRRKPDDPYLLGLYANTQFQLKNYHIALNGFSKLEDLQPEDRRWPISKVEALMAIAEGQVTPASLMIIDQILFKDPKNPSAHYIKGLFHQQRGENDKALAIWEAFTSQSAPDAPWMKTLMPQIRALKYPMPTIDPQTIQQITSLPESEQLAFFKAMADRLETRLHDIPDFPEAYMRLARTRLMTGNKQAAIKALQLGIKGSSDPAQATPLRQMLDNLRESDEN
ncbi:c-type cytochrome biogenesis protein CcmI [Temperatibacter marinus]|uniref:C-type cytochrome biogenesis protein CcmI n=1 Tax=Temperatibacter marinus TaxID=1456591 RepID=A0AA52EG63_9PROT|nr:c-type cytochrome biogenesis protein CcmI [Temperatibacter marinus]WND03073.1 c-type cytochrome biogenesis protein CcmI [Temperatibacter marinus]